MKKTAVLILALSTSSCIQSSLSYVKGASPKPLITMDQVLEESGLVAPAAAPARQVPQNPAYPSAAIDGSPTRTLEALSHTLETPPGRKVTLKVDTRNRLAAVVFYASPGFIYLGDESAPSRGEFLFQAGNVAGQIRIRLYNKDGSLSREERWFIEIRPL